MNSLLKNIRRWLRHNAAIASFFLLCLAALTAIWGLAWSQVGALGSRSSLIRAIRLISDAAVMLLPFWFLGRRFRWTPILLVWAAALWSVVSLCYTRFWGKPLELYSIFLTANFDGDLLRAGLSLCRPADIAYPLIAFVVNLFALIWRKRLAAAPRFSRSVRLWVVAVTLSLFLFAQLLALRSNLNGRRSGNDPTPLSQIVAEQFTAMRPAYTDIANSGVVVHLFKSTRNLHYLLTLPKTLTDSERNEIKQFIARTPGPAALPADIQAANRQKNLILLLVESLNAELIGMQAAGHKVTPTLDSLIHLPGTISALNVITQVRDGGSGDGQLLINTGLHPLPRFSTFVTCGDRVQFPSIALTLKSRTSAVFFGDNSKPWNERNSFANQCFDEIFDNGSYPAQGIGGDGAVMRFALSRLTHMPRPFFAEILTVSMHTPFHDPKVPASRIPRWIDTDTSHSPIVRSYLKMAHYFDSELARFIQGLRQAGLYDTSVIIIASDHSQDFATDTQGEIPMAFIALNTGLTQSINRRVGQIDLYPTILEIMGIGSEAPWHGAGTSILDPRLSATFTPATSFTGTPHPALAEKMIQAYRISELILRSNYFAQ